MKPLNTREQSRFVVYDELVRGSVLLNREKYFIPLKQGDECLVWIEIGYSAKFDVYFKLAHLRLIGWNHDSNRFKVVALYNNEEDYNALVAYEKLFL